MAEHVVMTVLNKLGDLLAQEALFLYGVPDQFKWVERELRWMKSFLKDAEFKSKQNDIVKQWLEDVRNAAYEAEGIVDLYQFDCLRKDFKGFVKRVLFMSKHQAGTRLGLLKAKIQDISQRRSTYGIIDRQLENEPEHMRQERHVLPYVDDDDIVGLENDKIKIIDQLLDNSQKQLCAFAIVGPGGLGKTTLARKVFNSFEIQNQFHARAWITVSQDYNFNDVLKKILGKISPSKKDGLEKMEREELTEELKELLRPKEYLIVLDDIWSKDLWQQLQAALPNEENGSRVIITTRSLLVAKEACTRSEPYELRYLNTDESTELLLKKAIPNGSCPEELLDLVPKFVKKCAGLPLALVVLGGLLWTSEKTYNTWSRVLTTMNWHIDGETCMQILSLSYEDLPYYLKSCFLYFATYPEDYEIHASTLVKMWIAEGFISGQERGTLEEIAEGFLEKLVHMSLVQVVRRKYNGSVKTCRVHDLLHELAVMKAQSVRFLTIYKEGDQKSTFDDMVRRLAIHHCNEFDMPKLVSLPTLCSFLVFPLIMLPSFHEAQFKLLRVLDLGNEYHMKIPLRGITRLFHLRYLRLQIIDLEDLPSSIGDLQNLETLDVRCRDLYTKTDAIITGRETKLRDLWMVKTLRHVHFAHHHSVFYPTEFVDLRNLQSLDPIYCGKSRDMMYLLNLTNLKKLELHIFDDLQVDQLIDSLKKLENLLSLWIYYETINFTYNCTFAHPTLQSLHFYGTWRMDVSCPWLETLELPMHLTKLTLQWTKLEEDPMPRLEKLPNLRILTLFLNAYIGEEMMCSGGGGFPQLSKLSLMSLRNLKRWFVADGSMPKLSYLLIIKCEELEMLPELQHISTLRELELRWMPKEFMDRARKDGEDWYKIRHIPSIIIAP